MKFLLILVFAFPVLSQNLSEIRGKKIYVVTESARAPIAKELKLVSDPKDAEVFLEYTILFRGLSDAVVGGLLVGSYEHGEMRAYYYRDQKQVVVWSGRGYGSPYNVPRKLAKQFRVALKASK